LRLQDVAKDGSEILMEFSSYTVVITGRYLAVVDDGISEGWIAALEAFDPAIRDAPKDKDAPFIERISFHPIPKTTDKKKPLAKPSPKHEPETVQRDKATL
jgi:hypothetical protein